MQQLIKRIGLRHNEHNELPTSTDDIRCIDALNALLQYGISPDRVLDCENWNTATN